MGAAQSRWVGDGSHSEHLLKKLCLWRPGHNRGEREGARVWAGLALWLIAEIISNVVEKSLTFF